MREKHGINISPKLHEEFLLRQRKRVTDLLNKNKIHCIMMEHKRKCRMLSGHPQRPEIAYNAG